MINIGKKLLNVALQYPAGLGVVLTRLIAKGTKTIKGFMRAFIFTARKGVGDKSPVKKGIKQPVNRMMNQPVSDAGFVDVSGFRVANVKSVITAVAVLTACQIIRYY